MTVFPVSPQPVKNNAANKASDARVFMASFVG